MQLYRSRCFPLRLNNKRTLKFFSVLFILFVFSAHAFAEVSPANGEKIFKQYCTSCHKPYPFDTKLVGPPLKDIDKQRSEAWLMSWIRNNAALRATGDKDALAIYNEYQHNEMPQFTSFTDDDIKSIIAYIATPPPPPPTAAAPGGPGGGGAPAPSTSIWLYLAITALLLVVIMLTRANKALKRMSLEQDGQPVPAEMSWGRRLRTPKAFFAYGLIIIFIAGWTLTSSAIRLAHSKNYSPEQPIHFSHKLHAGINQINCLYCHAGAEKSKVAGIPPLSTCMNCHKGVQAGQTDAGTAEIKKIYAAYDNDKPIQWIKIHNLPDHVYFNHSQHVAVGKLACQTCHGPIQDMDQVYQYASLSMGWCINCHRRTAVQFTQNGYYKMYSGLQEQIKKETQDSVHITEAMMGGTECQKCHY